MKINNGLLTLSIRFQPAKYDNLLWQTGGTAKAAADLVREMGGVVVAHLFFIELTGLNGRKVLKGEDVRALLTYE
jgi:adenine/guanine phosphoribosyltransferase-like PRPP-binding protein